LGNILEFWEWFFRFGIAIQFFIGKIAVSLGFPRLFQDGVFCFFKVILIGGWL
jgi:hypothetical protein